MNVPANLCWLCGVDVSKNNNRHPLSGKDIKFCPTLIDFATNATKAIPRPQRHDLHLNVQQFQAGYMCKEQVKLHTFQKQLSEIKEVISSKFAKTAYPLLANRLANNHWVQI